MSKPNWIKDAIKQPGKLKSKMGMRKMPAAKEEMIDAEMEKGGKNAASARKKDMKFHKKFGSDE